MLLVIDQTTFNNVEWQQIEQALMDMNNVSRKWVALATETDRIIATGGKDGFVLVSCFDASSETPWYQVRHISVRNRNMGWRKLQHVSTHDAR